MTSDWSCLHVQYHPWLPSLVVPVGFGEVRVSVGPPVVGKVVVPVTTVA